MIDPLTDRFEPFAVFRPLDAEHFELRITASENVILRIAERYATSCVLLEPSHLHERMKEQLAAALNAYNK
jgi:predicted DNA-binding transcriptional regulator YafY